MAYAFVRNLKTTSGANLKDFAQIQSAERHAKREDLTSQARQREDGDHRRNHFWSCAGEGLNGGGADYAAAFKAHKNAHGIKTERKGAALGLHLLVGVSPEWLAEKGDPRDLSNPRVRELIDHARLWAESWMGSDAVWAVRYDTDEAGAGVVDILASPVRENRAGKAKTGKPSISVNKALKELQEAHGERTSYAAMQTSWADYSRVHLDPALQRGQPESGRRHLTPEQFKARLAAEEATEHARREALRATERAKEAHQGRLQAETALRAAEGRLEPLRAAVAALDAWEAEKARVEADKELAAWWDMTPLERAKAMWEQRREAFRKGASGDEIRRLDAEISQLRAEAGTIIRVTRIDHETGHISGENLQTGEDVHARILLSEQERVVHYPDRGRDQSQNPMFMARKALKGVRELLGQVVIGAIVHLGALRFLPHSQEHIAAVARPCDPPRRDPRTTPMAEAAKPAAVLPEPVREAIRQTAPLNRATGPSPF